MYPVRTTESGSLCCLSLETAFIKNNKKVSLMKKIIRLTFLYEKKMAFAIFRPKTKYIQGPEHRQLAFQLSASGRTVGLQMSIIDDFKLGNCTHPRADYEIQLVGAGFVYRLKMAYAIFIVPNV